MPYIFDNSPFCLLKSLLNDMITEEAALKQRIGSNISKFQEQLETLCQEMSLEPSKVSG